MEKINFSDFKQDKSSIASVIYKNYPHLTTNKGVILEKEIGKELKRFFCEFHEFLEKERESQGSGYGTSFSKGAYYRLDAYFSNESITVLEINSLFVDGWGTALNLSRASDIPVDTAKLKFPKNFGFMENDYFPELNLFSNELKLLESTSHEIHLNWEEIWRQQSNGVSNIDGDWYVYGRHPHLYEPFVYPQVGQTFQRTNGSSESFHTLDSKINLALFSNEWDGDLVRTPKHYLQRTTSWEDIPQNVVLKFCEKDSEECKRSRQSVLFGKPEGKAKFLKQCYQKEMLIAQDFVAPYTQVIKESSYIEDNCQLIIFVIGDSPVTGYVQYSHDKLINDNSIHGPLWIK